MESGAKENRKEMVWIIWEKKEQIINADDWEARLLKKKKITE